MQLKKISLFLLWNLGVANAFAAAASFQHEGRAAVRAYHVQGVSMERNEQRNQLPMPPQNDNRRPEFGIPDSSGSSGQGERQSSSDNARKQGKMSPEERRTLRRQIDEVGHDIYAPKR